MQYYSSSMLNTARVFVAQQFSTYICGFWIVGASNFYLPVLDRLCYTQVSSRRATSPVTTKYSGSAVTCLLGWCSCLLQWSSRSISDSWVCLLWSGGPILWILLGNPLNLKTYACLLSYFFFLFGIFPGFFQTAGWPSLTHQDSFSSMIRSFAVRWSILVTY